MWKEGEVFVRVLWPRSQKGAKLETVSLKAVRFFDDSDDEISDI